MTVDAAPGGSVAADAGTGSTDASATTNTPGAETVTATVVEQRSTDGVRTSGIADPGSQVTGLAGDQQQKSSTSTTTDPKPPADTKGQEPAGDAKSGKGTRDINVLPEWAQKEIKDARRGEAAKRDAAKAAEESTREIEAKHQELLSGIAKVLGLAPDEDPANTDPAELTKQLTQARDEHRAARIELAVYRAAGEHEGDPESLLDSRAFLDRVLKLDPADQKFASKISEAIRAAVADNPKLRATPVELVPPASGPGAGFSQGPTAGASSVESFTVDDFRKMRRKGNSG